MLAAAGIEVIVVGSNIVKQLLEQAEECQALKYVICIDRTLPEDVTTLAKEKNIELRTFEEVMVSVVIADNVCSFNDISSGTRPTKSCRSPGLCV